MRIRDFLSGRYRKLAVFLVAAVLLSLVYWMVHESGWGFSDKMVWDLLQLLAIPVALVVGVWLVNRAVRRAERNNALERQREAELTSLERQLEAKLTTLERQQEAMLTTYMYRLSELLLVYDFRVSAPDSEARTVAIAHTRYVLRNLDGPRIAHVLRFLTELELGGTELLRIDLAEADLRGADLTELDLRGANLTGVIVTPEQIAGSRLENATMPDGTKYEDWVARGKPDWNGSSGK